MFARLARSVALLCATLLVAARDIRAAQYGSDDVLIAAKKFEAYINGDKPNAN